MTGGPFAPALLCAALGFALAFAPRGSVLPSLLGLVAAAVAMAFVPLAPAWRETAFLVCWATLILTAAMVHLPGGPGPKLALALGVGAGAAGGAIVSVAGVASDLLKALPWALLCVPGAWLVARGQGIAIKVASSWLIAVAILAAALPITPTPGYEPDHMQ